MAVKTVLQWGELALLFLYVAWANEPQGLLIPLVLETVISILPRKGCAASLVESR